MRLAGGTSLPEFTPQFVQAAIAADHRFTRTGDATDVRKGIALWERVSGVLAGEPAEALVDLHLTVAMLYARRFQADGTRADLEHALRLLRHAQQHVIPGSPADQQARTATAGWLMLRFDADGDRADVDQAIAGWMELFELQPPGSVDRGLSATNLGLALQRRHEAFGDPEDLAGARGFLATAAAELPRGHPAQADIRRRLAR